MKLKLILCSIILLGMTGVSYAHSCGCRALDCQQHYPQGRYFHHSCNSCGLYLPAYQYPRFGFYGCHYHQFRPCRARHVHGFYRCYDAQGLSKECYRY